MVKTIAAPGKVVELAGDADTVHSNVPQPAPSRLDRAMADFSDENPNAAEIKDILNQADRGNRDAKDLANIIAPHLNVDDRTALRNYVNQFLNNQR